jgi:hypothetical protein
VGTHEQKKEKAMMTHPNIQIRPALLNKKPAIEADTMEFIQALAAFQESLPPRQRDLFTAILAPRAQTNGADAEGYAVHTSRLGPVLDQTLSNAQRIVREFAASLAVKG